MLPTADKIARLIFPARFWQINPQFAEIIRELSLLAKRQKAMLNDGRQLIKSSPLRTAIYSNLRSNPPQKW